MSSKRWVAIAAVSLFCAVVVPLDRPGIGWFAAAAAMVAVCGGFMRLPIAAALVLCATGTIRAAGWVFALCVAMALLLAAVTIVRGHTWRELALAIPRWIGSGFRALPAPPDRHGAVRVVRALALGAVLTVGFGLLLASADTEFKRLLDGVSTARILVAIVVLLLCLGAVRLRTTAPTAEVNPERESWARLDWLIPVTFVNVLFAAFAGVQFKVLFGGHKHVLDADGPTYAQYARHGFVLLAVVTALTLAVVAVVLSRLAEADRTLGRIMIGILCGLTLVIVASALGRMHVYAEAFGYTRMRLLSAAAIVWLGLIFLLILVLGRHRAIPRLVLWSAVIVLGGLVVINPDRYIAQTVVGRWEKDQHLDAPYLATMSPDALPALAKLPTRQRVCITEQILKNTPKDPWYALNSARIAARKAKLVPAADCEFYLSEGYRLEGNWIDPSELTNR